MGARPVAIQAETRPSAATASRRGRLGHPRVSSSTAPLVRALVATGDAAAPLQMRDVAEPAPASNEALIEVRNFSLNRGELRLLASRPSGWRPGQDIAGTVLRAANDGSGPPVGSRVVAMVDQ